ncbi:ABC transporter, permease protein [Lactiplantibacillus pentosus KCA1]|nr:ABC transporter permease [Lactiplantibacillus pentosus]EIW13993.1 ABC transporter, permease protein [Lactiplantibacillus pentosus KCA1]
MIPIGNRILKQIKFKELVFLRTPILYLTSYMIPIFALWKFGKPRNGINIIDGVQYYNYYIPIFLTVSMISITIFTVGIDLVNKNEHKLYKRIILAEYSQLESYIADSIFAYILSLPNFLILILGEKILYGHSITIGSLWILLPLLLLAFVNTAISYVMFCWVDSSKVSGPIQISVFGFTLYSLGVFLPYAFLGSESMRIIKITPYFYQNKLMMLAWNNSPKFGLSVVALVTILIGFSVVFFVISILQTKLYKFLSSKNT